ncbi:hypothetical protein QMG83_07950 [Salinibacterium sp. G-O1]|uniref:hypothetical protein n=1 Tax=Salinibacterium sp. G-O1 TaxID=3046208 RepID=UPI0024B986DF|nr:hypothetical protein [Salinibacterium sp. G-O1]MDJ0335155.1 hypothetical protein [Salinibacterium sp. G-O1]
MRLDIDLSFSVEADSHIIAGTVQAAGAAVTVFVDDPAAFLASGVVRRGALPPIVNVLAAEGVSVTVKGPKGVIASVGAVPTSTLSRIISGSPHVRLGGVSAMLNAVRRSSGAPTVEMPPATMFPLVPTMSRRIQRHATTTHYLRGSGRPRLIFVVGSEVWDGKPPREFLLPEGTTTIGSSDSADLQLEGLEPIHAEIRHDEHDDYVFQSLAGDTDAMPVLVQPRSSQPSGRILRTGARIELGPWRMGFFREEYADHGRPYGGRTGGELAHQKRQPGPRGERS